MAQAPLVVDSHFLTRVFVAIAKGVNFINGAERETDFVTMGHRIRMQHFLHERNLDRFPISTDRQNPTELYEKYRGLVDSYMKHIADMRQMPTVDIYKEILYLESMGITSYCRGCRENATCMTAFADEFLPTLAIRSSPESSISQLTRQILASHQKEIQSFLDETAIRDGKNILGWRHSYSKENGHQVDAYTTLHILNFLVNNPEFERTFSPSFDSIVLSILNLQKKDQDLRQLEIGVTRSPEGAWSNIYWGEERTQLDVTAQMSDILLRIQASLSEKTREQAQSHLARARQFMERAFCEYDPFINIGGGGKHLMDWKPYALDYPQHEDWFFVNVSDIPGTAAALQTLLEFGLQPDSPEMLGSLTWLLDAQDQEDGSWPVLSKTCWTWAERMNLFDRPERNALFLRQRANKSISNTALMLRLLVSWLDHLVKRRLESFRDDTLYSFENFLRQFISEKCEYHWGNGWWEFAVPDKVREDIKTRKEADEREGKEPDVNMNYTTLWDCHDIIKHNWNKIFKDYFEDEATVLTRFKDLSDLRAKVYHNRKMPEDYARQRDAVIQRLRACMNRPVKPRYPRNELQDLLRKYAPAEYNPEEMSLEDIAHKLAKIRQRLRQRRTDESFTEADRIRDTLRKMGIHIEDTDNEPAVEFR